MQDVWHDHDAEMVIEEHELHDPNNHWYMIQGLECEVSLEPRPTYCDRGNWIAKLFPAPGSALALELDHHDGWPRYYFDKDRALAEIEAWLRKRRQMPLSASYRGP